MKSKPVHVFAKWRVKEGQLQTVLTLLKEVSEKSTKEAGNLVYKVYQSNADANTILLFEGYADEEAVTRHRESEHFQKLVVEKIVPLLENREVVLATQLTFD
ncbi:putative quinol monooxygenase [Chryseolinea lacunae]|uniref:Antibiotic biosynthesis monooxygenase n=1 Tax=Chryseolinea lacunae TaxID=2801331 RepID=A0ABS1KUZ0_9BACT|nr:putative quinol monooxygenase [Chryseolinea lacunae]MBL0743008.1 antibiotic biosynthesis monooxygenase [Chryseolinea lacunae]